MCRKGDVTELEVKGRGPRLRGAGQAAAEEAGGRASSTSSAKVVNFTQVLLKYSPSLMFLCSTDSMLKVVVFPYCSRAMLRLCCPGQTPQRIVTTAALQAVAPCVYSGDGKRCLQRWCGR